MRKYSQPLQRCRNGQECPPAATLVGSVQTPNGTATWPTSSRQSFRLDETVDTGSHEPTGTVELERAEAVLGFAFAFGGDPVVAERGPHRVVTEELLEGVDRCAGVGVALGEGVPEGVGGDRSRGNGTGCPAVSRSGASRRGRALTHWRMARWSCDVRSGRVPSGLVSGRGNRASSRRGVVGNWAATLACWARMMSGLSFVDREPASDLVDLGHVVDEHRAAPMLTVGVDVVVVVEAVEGERAQLGGPSADTGSELDRCADGGPGELLRARQGWRGRAAGRSPRRATRCRPRRRVGLWRAARRLGSRRRRGATRVPGRAG